LPEDRTIWVPHARRIIDPERDDIKCASEFWLIEDPSVSIRNETRVISESAAAERAQYKSSISIFDSKAKHRTDFPLGSRRIDFIRFRAIIAIAMRSIAIICSGGKHVGCKRFDALVCIVSEELDARNKRSSTFWKRIWEPLKSWVEGRLSAHCLLLCSRSGCHAAAGNIEIGHV
jgi:hypothetical protein